MVDIPSYAVEVELGHGDAQSCTAFLQQKWGMPIIARISHEKLVFGARTLQGKGEIEQIANALDAYLQATKEL